jgi:GLPGLI family protein
MKGIKYIIRFLFLFSIPVFLNAQKQVGELTLIYNSAISHGDDVSKKINSTTAYYLKGNLSRSEISSSQFSSITIYDSKAGSGVILKEVNGQKLLIRFNQENWYQKNIRFANLKFAKTAETKTIAGYLCNQATAATADGYRVIVFYTREIIPVNKGYDPPFKSLDGLPLEYEFAKGDTHIRYTLSSINLNPVPASKFDIPTSGYRELTYEESLKLNGQ